MTQSSNPSGYENWQALSQLEGQIRSFLDVWPFESLELKAALTQVLLAIHTEKEKIGENLEPITAAVYSRDDRSALAQCQIYARRNRIKYTRISVETKKDMAGGFYYVCKFT